MSINIMIFGQLATLTGKDKFTLEGLKDTNALKQDLQARYPALTNIKYAIAVDKKVIRENTILKPDTDVALLPPFSGG